MPVRLSLAALLAAQLLLAPSPGAGQGALHELGALCPLPAAKAGNQRFALGDIHGFVHVLEQRERGFAEVWVSPYYEGAIGGLWVVDLDGDERKELFLWTDQGRLYTLDLESYSVTWNNPPAEYKRVTALAVHNVDDDPQLELIFCADGRLVVYDGRDHFEEWRSHQTDLTTLDIVVADVDGDGAEEIVLNDGYVFDARFHDLEWQSAESFGERLGLLDVDEDGIPEVIGEFAGRFLKVFDMDLRREKSVGR